jgi:hypothetical protein
VKWWKKLFFHFFELSFMIVHILHWNTSIQNLWLYSFIEKVAEVLGTEIRGQSHTNPAGRLVDRGHYPYSILAVDCKQSGRLQHECEVCTSRETSHRNGHSKVNDCALFQVYAGLCLGEHFKAHRLKLK